MQHRNGVRGSGRGGEQRDYMCNLVRIGASQSNSGYGLRSNLLVTGTRRKKKNGAGRRWEISLSKKRRGSYVSSALMKKRIRVMTKGGDSPREKKKKKGGRCSYGRKKTRGDDARTTRADKQHKR